MSCLTHVLVCPVGAVDGECSWNIECCDGIKRNISIPEEDQQEVCLSSPYRIIKTSISGSSYKKTPEETCATNCGYADPTPILPSPPTPSPTPAPSPGS